MKLICVSCGVNVTGQEEFVKFNCPNCNDNVIIRCKQCKKLANTYKCTKCSFEGP